MAEQQPPAIGVPEFKLVLIGGDGVGTKEFLESFIAVESEKKYLPTLDIMVYPLQFFTNRGPIKFNVWDTTAKAKFGLHDGCLVQGECAIIMFDVTSRITYKYMPNYDRDITRVCGDIPIILAGNNVDVLDRKVKRKQITFHRKKGHAYFDISVKYNHNLLEMFLALARTFAADKTLRFVRDPSKQCCIAPQAACLPLPDDVKRRVTDFFHLGILHNLDCPIPDEVQERLQPSSTDLNHAFRSRRRGGHQGGGDGTINNQGL